jgi:MoxR-like ATPase
MQEKRVSSGGEDFKLDEPFFVLATQNPIEQEGTLSVARSPARPLSFQYHSQVSEQERGTRHHAAA